MQETQVRSLIQEDPTCHGATKPVHHNYWACALEPGNWNYWNPHALEPLLHKKISHHKEKPTHCNKEKPAHCNKEKPPLSATREKPVQQWRPSTAINEINNIIIIIFFALGSLCCFFLITLF